MIDKRNPYGKKSHYAEITAWNVPAISLILTRSGKGQPNCGTESDGENVLFQIARFPVPAVLPTNSVLTSWWNVRKNMGWKNAISAVSFLAPK